MAALAATCVTESAPMLITALSARSATQKTSQTSGNQAGPSADARTPPDTPTAIHAKMMMISLDAAATAISATSLGRPTTLTDGIQIKRSADVYRTSIGATSPTVTTSATIQTTALVETAAIAAAGPGHPTTHYKTSRLMPCADVQMSPFFSEIVHSHSELKGPKFDSLLKNRSIVNESQSIPKIFPSNLSD